MSCLTESNNAKLLVSLFLLLHITSMLLLHYCYVSVTTSMLLLITVTFLLANDSRLRKAMVARHSLCSSVSYWHAFGGERNKNNPGFHKKTTNYLQAYHSFPHCG